MSEDYVAATTTNDYIKEGMDCIEDEVEMVHTGEQTNYIQLL